MILNTERGIKTCQNHEIIPRRKMSQMSPLNSIWVFVLVCACEFKLKHPETGLQRSSSKFQATLKRFFFCSASMVPARRRGGRNFMHFIHHPKFEGYLCDLDSVFLTPVQKSELFFDPTKKIKNCKNIFKMSLFFFLVLFLFLF